MLGTGVGDMYLAFLQRVFPDVMADLLAAWQKVEDEYPPAERENGLRKTVLVDKRLGPFARTVLGLWYTAVWTPMSHAWNVDYGDHHDHQESSFLAAAYAQGLMWRVVPGAHPEGARPTGFGSWASPPAEG